MYVCVFKESDKMKNKIWKYLFCSFFVIFLSITKVNALETPFTWEVAINNTRINSAEELCNFDFGNISKLGDPNRDYSGVIKEELNQINNMYSSCVQYGQNATYPDSRCYAVGSGKNDSNNESCNASLHVEWHFPAYYESSASCDTGRYESYRLVAQTYCPSDDYESLVEKCQRCEGYDFSLSASDPNYDEQCVQCEAFVEHKDDAGSFEECIQNCSDVIGSYSCRQECEEKYESIDTNDSYCKMCQEEAKTNYEECLETGDTTDSICQNDYLSELETCKRKYNGCYTDISSGEGYGDVDCSLLEQMLPTVQTVFNLICYIMVGTLAIFTMIDFTKVVITAENDGQKKAFKRLVIRIIIIFIIFMLPQLIDLVLGLFGIESCIIE